MEGSAGTGTTPTTCSGGFRRFRGVVEVWGSAGFGGPAAGEKFEIWDVIIDGRKGKIVLKY